MYRIYLNDDLIYAPGSEDLVVIDPQLELELNSPGEFTFTIPEHNPYYNSPVKMISRVEVKRDDETIFYGRIIDETIDFWKKKKLICEGELAYLNDSIQRPAEYHDLTVREYLETLIEEHNGQVDEDKQFTVGIVTVEDSNDSLYRYTNYNSTMEELKDDLIDDLGGYLRVRYQEGVRYLDYVNAVDYGITNDDAIRFGRNLLDFTQNMDVTDIATVIIPLGERLEESPIEALDMRLTIESVNGGKDWIQSDEAVELYGRIVKTVVWDGVTQADNLLSKGEKYLSDTQWDQAELTVSAIDLNMADKDLDAFHLGDQLRVVSDPHGLDRYFPLSKMDLDLDEPQNNSYTLGISTSPSLLGQLITQTDLSNQLGSMNARSSSITNAKIDEAKTSVLDEAIENATIIINSKTANGHVVLDSPYEEILIMDTDDKDTALRVWRWNVNGLGYSTTGYSGPYGLAMTMDGSIVADYITTGTLNADLVRTGVIKALSGDNYWDMDSGEMKVGGWNVGAECFWNGIDSLYSDGEGVILSTSGLKQNFYQTETGTGRQRGYEGVGFIEGAIPFYFDNEEVGRFESDVLLQKPSSSDNYHGVRINGSERIRLDVGDNLYGYLCQHDDDVYTHTFRGNIATIGCDTVTLNSGASVVLSSSGLVRIGSSITLRQESSVGSGLCDYLSGDWLIHHDSSFRAILGNSSRVTILYGSSVYLNGTSTAVTSDRSLKSDIQPLNKNYENLIDCLTPRAYTVDAQPDQKHIGFVVDEVEDAMKSAGLNPDDYGLTDSFKDDDGKELGAIRYEEIIPILVYEIQQLKAEIAELKKVT